MKLTFTAFLLLFFGVTTFAQDSISVLFIGNSYTYVNDLPATVSSLATSLGKTVTYQTKANGGYTFQAHVNDPATFTAMHASHWDVVVLQGQSQEPSFPYNQVNSGTLPYAQQLADSVYAFNPCGNVMYFMSWGRENGDSQWDSINTFDKMNQRLYDAYLRIADSSHSAMVSAVGAVWKYVRDNFPTIGLYQSDGSHPSEAGTYLAACTFYASLFQESPVGATFIGNLDAQTVLILQQAAESVILQGISLFNLHEIDHPTCADFVLNQNGNAVDLENLSSQAGSSVWDFGDGIQSTETNPVHTYTNSGNFTIQLIVNGVCNADTLVQEISIVGLGLEENASDKIFWQATETGFRIYGTFSGMEIAAFNLLGEQVYSEKIIDKSSVEIYTDEQILLLKIGLENKVITIQKMAR